LNYAGREIMRINLNTLLTSLPIFIIISVLAFTAYADGPSFDCSKVEAGSIEEIICKNESLSAMDVTLAEVYKEAEKKALNEHPPVLKAKQRGWIKGRNECWKSEDKEKCIEDSYMLRIAELQARYRLVTSKGPYFYACDGNPANEIVMTFFETDPPTLIAERGDSTSLMYLQPSGSGSKYQGRNESVWIKGDEAMVTWGYEAPEMKCEQKS
jgi:uncharacterized protein